MPDPASKIPDPVHLLLPMAGLGQRFRDAGYTDPKPLIKVSATPMIERLLRRFPAHWPCTFVLSEHHAKTALPALLQTLRPGCALVYLADAAIAQSPLRGAGRSVWEGLKHLPEDGRVFVSYCDYGMVWDSVQFEEFVRASDCEACLVSYRGFHAHYLSPLLYAYSQLRGELVTSVREKGCFTADREQEYASAGGYYFRSASLLRKALAYQAEQGLQTNGEHYISLTVESVLRLNPQAAVRVFEIPLFCQWGTPADLEAYTYWEKTFTEWNKQQSFPATYRVAQVLMPMAGAGSRFTKATAVAKPFIEVAGRPMFLAALRSLPRGDSTCLVSLRAHQVPLEACLSEYKAAGAIKAEYLDTTPPGQALSTQQGVKRLDPQQEVVVSSCDHEIVLNPSTWATFQSDPRCEAAIFTVRGYPGVQRRPAAFAYVDADFGSEPLPLVRRVSVKAPLSTKPLADALLVGTFWFASVAILNLGIEALRKRDHRVNGELYLDSIFAELLLLGYRVRAIPLDGYIGRGTPDELAESLYYQELFSGRRSYPRERYHLRGHDGHG